MGSIALSYEGFKTQGNSSREAEQNADLIPRNSLHGFLHILYHSIHHDDVQMIVSKKSLAMRRFLRYNYVCAYALDILGFR